MTAAERPATGATDAQIEETAKRTWTERMSVPWDDLHELQREMVRGKIRHEACRLVPPGTVIALAEHVADAADRAAIGRAKELVKAAHYLVQRINQYGFDPQKIGAAVDGVCDCAEPITADHLARMDRLSGEGEL